MSDTTPGLLPLLRERFKKEPPVPEDMKWFLRAGSLELDIGKVHSVGSYYYARPTPLPPFSGASISIIKDTPSGPQEVTYYIDPTDPARSAMLNIALCAKAMNKDLHIQYEAGTSTPLMV